MTKTKAAARLVLILLVLMMGYGLVVNLRAAPAPAQHPHVNPAQIDVILYRAVAKRVGAGENYYTAVMQEQRTRGIEVRPFMTVRPPLLAYVTGALGETGMLWAMRLVAFITFIALAVRLEALVPDLRQKLVALLIGALGIFMLITPITALLHDVWASLLITLSLLLRRPKHWWPSVLLGLIAALTRELNMPYLVLMAAMAFWEKRPREGRAWLGALGIALGCLALHAHNVMVRELPSDLPSVGWSKHLGWPFILMMMQKDSILRLAPAVLNAVLVPLAFLGWFGWRNPFALRVSLWLSGMALIFMIFGRPANFYWGLYLAYFLPMGLVFAPQTLTALTRTAFTRRVF